MLKQSAMLEVKIGENIYQLHLPANSPLGEVHDAIFQMRSFIVAKMNEAIKADEEAKLANQPKVETTNKE